MRLVWAILVISIPLVYGSYSFDETTDIRDAFPPFQDPPEQDASCVDNAKPKRCKKFQARGCCAESSKCFKKASKKCAATCGLCKEPGGGNSDSLDVAACLQAHNAKRTLHQATDKLEWDESLAKGAQKWADHLKATGKLEHDDSGHGENIGWSRGWPEPQTCAEAVEGWYAEIKDYPFEQPPDSIFDDSLGGKQIGHFTQVVWRSTKKVGVARAIIKHVEGERVSYETYTVARYSPPGNYRGEFDEEVGKLIE